LHDPFAKRSGKGVRMFCKGLAELRKSVLPLAMAMAMATLVAGTYVAFSSAAAAAATAESRTMSSTSATTGVWPGVGKICEPGSGGASSVRGVGAKTINIAEFNDAASSIEPGLEVEFVQQAKAFADWCNAAGGINGRQIVIDDRDAALFNAAQQATAACQSDFMAVGGGMALDQPSVPIREKCGLGQISGYVVSDASDLASDQVDPSGINTDSVTSGWFGALAKAYPQAVKAAGMGGQDNPSILEPETKFEFGAEAQGWHVVDFAEPPVTVTDWAPYVEDYQSKGAEALWPADTSNIAPFIQAMATAGYHPAFIALGTQFANSMTQQAVAANPSLPPVYVETSWWPLSIASQNPSTEQLVKVMHTYAKGDSIDFDDEEGAESWLLWAKSASACGATLTVACVLNGAAAVKNWDAGGIEAPIAKLTLSNENPQPSPCFALMKIGSKGILYDKAITKPTQSIWNCNTKNVVHLTSQEQQQLASL
jgi:ABC-type branched-subunit amino acid transport system substrate-binding protein